MTTGRINSGEESNQRDGLCIFFLRANSPDQPYPLLAVAFELTIPSLHPAF